MSIIGLLIGGVLVMIWLAVAFSATVSAFTAKSGVARKSLWLVALWTLPLIGVTA